MTTLVTGGAGYIGAHVIRALTDRGRPVVVVDDLSTGDASRVASTPLVRMDVASPDATSALVDVMRRHEVTSIVHLAGRKRVDESMVRPLWYARQNIDGLVNVLSAAETAQVGTVLFSSSAAVYGDVREPLVHEDTPTVPINPYGETKLVGEWLVRDHVRASGGRAAALRYFNVAGSGWPGLGDPAVLNLVTMTLERLERGLQPTVFGTDYPTSDGSCVRDFVHVRDLAEAHVAVLERLDDWPEGSCSVFNVGTGHGSSVLEVVASLAALWGDPRPAARAGRRPGDPAQVVASADRLREATGWRARFGLEEILTSAVEAWRERRA